MVRKCRLLKSLLSLVLAIVMVVGIVPPIEVSAEAPNITTEAAYDIEMYEATVSAYIKTNGGNLFKEHGFYYGTTTSCDKKVVVDDNGGSGTSLDTPDRYTYTFDNLKMGTKYYYKAYVLTTNGTYYYGGRGDFTTETLEYDIEVDTLDTDGEQTMNTITMRAELYVDVNYGKASSLSVGFECGVKGGTQRKIQLSSRHYDGDEFEYNLIGLQPGTTYTYRGYAINILTGEYIYGERVTITTLDESDYLPEVSTYSASDISLNSAVISGSLDYTADVTTEYGFILQNSASVKIGSTSKTKEFEYEWDDLQPNTKYIYRAYAKNKYGTIEGSEKSFFTKSDTAKPVIELLKSSLGNEFEEGSTVTFYAEASDNVALSEFILYVDNVEVDYSDYWTDYEELEYSTSKLSVGTHTIKAYAVDDAGNEATKTITVKVTVPAAPCVTNLTASEDSVCVGEKFSFTITANNSVSGVQLYVKENGNTYNIGSSTTATNTSSTSKTFIIDNYSFNSTGVFENGYYVTNTRRVYAYPIVNGDVIEDDSVGDYCDITVTPAKYSLGGFSIYDTEVEIGDSATIRWTAAEAETNDTVYYNVYIGTKTSTILLTLDKISARSITVDSSLIKELGTGTYAVMVIATAANHSQKQANANITINASTVSDDTTKPVINPISSSADPIVFGTSVTFSTAASDETALDRVEMYVDGTLVKKVSATDTYANISYTTDSLSSSSHTVLVKAYDEAGNYNSWSQNFTVKTISAGIVYDVELSDYDFYAGSYITFTVKTSKDTTKIRLVDGSYAFSVQSSGYKDSGNYRIWTFEQYVGTVGTNRKLRVESYSNGWTGNYYTTDLFTVRKNIEDLGAFEILTPVSGDRHQINTSLTVTWSTPSVKPDWYVVNVSGVPSGSDLISINGNSAVISGSVFDEYGTYSISVTAQKSGYNQSETYTNVVVGCLHEDRTLVGVKQGSEVYYNDSKHKVVVTPKYSCNTCGGTFTSSDEATTEYIEHNHDVELDNNGWFCDCGYVDSGSYTPWTGYLQSNSKEKAYSRIMSDGELTNWDGVSRVYADDTITVVGTKFDAFLIQYSLDSGGTKTRFVDRTLVDRMEYTGRSIVYVSIDGLDLRCIQEGNGTLYASAYDLATVLNGSCSFVSNNKLHCRMKVYDSVSALNYYWEADLRNYNARANWQNLNAYTDESLTTLAKSAFAGAYVYCGEVNISIKGVLELLSYESVGENAYSKKNIDYDLIKTASYIRDTDTMFTAVSNEVPWEWTSYAYSVAKFDVIGLGVAIADNTAFANEETVIALKKSLMLKRSDDHDKAAQETVLKIFEIIEDVYNIQKEQTENSAEAVELSVDYYENFDLDIIIKAYEEQVDDKPGLKEPLEALKKKKEELGNIMDQMDAAMTVFDITTTVAEYSAKAIDQMYTMWVLTQNYDDNVAYLNELISTTDNSYMKEVYTDVLEGLKDCYSEGLSTYLSSDQQGIIFDLLVDIGDISAGLIDEAFGISDYIDAGIKSGKYGKAVNVLLLVHAGVSFVADFAFKGQDMYDAVADIYRAVDAIPLLVDDLDKTISKYRSNPTEKNLELVRTSAAFLAEYRVSALEHCETYLNSLISSVISVSAVTAEKNNIARWRDNLY